MLYPQNGDSFATTDSATSLHPISLLLVVWMTSVTWCVWFTAVLQKSSRKYSAGGATVFDFVVVYSGSKLRTGSEVCFTLLSTAALLVLSSATVLHSVARLRALSDTVLYKMVSPPR